MADCLVPAGLTPIYIIVSFGQGHRGLIFNGDLDMACNHLGDYYFAESLQQPVSYNDPYVCNVN